MAKNTQEAGRRPQGARAWSWRYKYHLIHRRGRNVAIKPSGGGLVKVVCVLPGLLYMGGHRVPALTGEAVHETCHASLALGDLFFFKKKKLCSSVFNPHMCLCEGVREALGWELQII